ncbi:MAG: hypothetical protein HQ567_13565, partial [Candidatus Nealsonbacteria bacterium]|nr:hypothetical protein [Candidatus Nealsonbacteria bacterium]
MNRRIRQVMRRALLVLCCLLSAQSASADTVTVVTHGADFFLPGDLLTDMGDALYDYWEDQPGGAVEYVYQKSTLKLVVRNGVHGNPNKIIVFDWSAESDRAQGGYDEAAGDALFAMLVANDLLDSDYLHLIGHSRGTIVSSEAAQRIVHHGYSVNQLTLLDTEPGPSSLRVNMAGPAHAWYGIDFVDNYYGNGSWSAAGTLQGEPIAGAYDRYWDTDHNGVHKSYTKTIENSNPTDGFYWRVNDQERPTATGLPTPVTPPPDVVNGDFQYGLVVGATTARRWIPGWYEHGGGGRGHVDDDPGPNYCLELDWEDEHKKHNWLYAPEDIVQLVFLLTVTDPSFNDVFTIELMRQDGLVREFIGPDLI